MAKVKIPHKTEEEILRIKYRNYIIVVNRVLGEIEEGIKKVDRYREMSKITFEEWRIKQKL